MDMHILWANIRDIKWFVQGRTCEHIQHDAFDFITLSLEFL